MHQDPGSSCRHAAPTGAVPAPTCLPPPPPALPRPGPPCPALQRAEELRQEREQRAVKFGQGKAAYARGWYAASVALFEQALNEEGSLSQLGGEVQLWLALAYQACGREQECIDTYKTVEKTHPMPSIRRQVRPRLFPCPLHPPRQVIMKTPNLPAPPRALAGCLRLPSPPPALAQAAELRFIMEAPKLQLSPEEKVQIPVLTDLDPNK